MEYVVIPKKILLEILLTQTVIIKAVNILEKRTCSIGSEKSSSLEK